MLIGLLLSVDSGSGCGYTTNGVITWGYSFSPGMSSAAGATDNEMDLLGDLYIGILTLSPASNDSTEVGVIFVDSLGNAYYYMIGRDYYREKGKKIAALSTNSLIVAATTNLNPGDPTLYPMIIKMNRFGTISWARRMSLQDTLIEGVTPSADRRYVYVLFRNRVVKLDTFGNLLWAREYDGEYYDIVPTDDGGALLAGYLLASFQYDPLMVKISPSGSVDWAYRFVFSNNYERFYAIRRVTDGFVGVGITSQWLRYTSSDGYTGFVLKVDNTGNIIWAVAVDMADYRTYPYSVAEFSDGYRMVGSYYGSSSGSFIVDISLSGEVRSTVTENLLFFGKAINHNGSLVTGNPVRLWRIAGGTYSPCVVPFTPETLTVTDSIFRSAESITVSSLSVTTTSIVLESRLLASRRDTLCNPTGDTSALDVSERTGVRTSDILVYDASGRLIYKGKRAGLSLPRRGIYFIVQESRVRRIIIR